MGVCELCALYVMYILSVNCTVCEMVCDEISSVLSVYNMSVV